MTAEAHHVGGRVGREGASGEPCGNDPWRRMELVLVKRWAVSSSGLAERSDVLAKLEGRR